jgi:hypothetical protein
MKRTSSFTLVIALLAAPPHAFAQAPPGDALGGNAGAEFARPQAPRLPSAAAGETRTRLLRWHEIAMAATALDHTPPPAGDPRVFREQLGPHRSARALAMVHIAMFDALNALTGNRFRSYTGLPAVTQPASVNLAVATAAYGTLIALWPAQKAIFDARILEDLAEVPDGPEKVRGVAVGGLAAAAILARRHNDGSAHAEPVVGVDYFPGDGPGEWRPDPVSQLTVALGAHWGEVTPFVMLSPAQFRSAAPPALSGGAYAAAYDEVKRLGGDGETTPTERTPQQTVIGIYWGYDGTPNLAAPPRLYNQITVAIANQRGTGSSDPMQLARLLALVNTALADAAIACWETKYTYRFWRPVTAIREGDTDDNAATEADPGYTPLGAPASNTNPGVNFTPPFPAYPSGHATFGGAVFQTLRRFYGTDSIALTFVSDELNGVTTDNHGDVRPLIPRSFASLSAAEEENGQSRIYLGIHWRFDKTAGIAQGRKVADLVFGRAFQKR